MLNIAYTARDAHLAEAMQQDLVSSGLTLAHDYLLVLISGAALQDAGVIQTVKEASRQNLRVIPVLIERVPLPPEITGAKPLDFSRGYRKDRLVYYLRWTDIGKDKIAGNRLIMAFMVAVVIIMFIAAWIGITGGLVAFPQGEYETQSAIENATINAMVIPTLDAFMPRTTEDATDFPLTLQAAPTRLKVFLAQTATAIPANSQARRSFQETTAAQTMTMQAAAANKVSLTVTTTPNG